MNKNKCIEKLINYLESKKKRVIGFDDFLTYYSKLSEKQIIDYWELSRTDELAFVNDLDIVGYIHRGIEKKYLEPSQIDFRHIYETFISNPNIGDVEKNDALALMDLSALPRFTNEGKAYVIEITKTNKEERRTKFFSRVAFFLSIGLALLELYKTFFKD